MTNPKKNGDLMLRVRYDSGAELAGPAVITDEGALLVSLGGAASMLVQRADGSLPPHITFVDIERIDDDDEENGSAADRPGRPEESGGRSRPHQVVRNSKGWEQPLFP